MRQIHDSLINTLMQTPAAASYRPEDVVHSGRTCNQTMMFCSGHVDETVNLRCILEDGPGGNELTVEIGL